MTPTRPLDPGPALTDVLDPDDATHDPPRTAQLDLAAELANLEATHAARRKRGKPVSPAGEARVAALRAVLEGGATQLDLHAVHRATLRAAVPPKAPAKAPPVVRQARGRKAPKVLGKAPPKPAGGRVRAQ